MKKYFLFLLSAVLTLGFTACEDIPAPYGIFDQGNGGEGGGDEGETAEPEGDGTLATPFNVAGINEYISSLEADVNSPTVYIKGIVVSVKEEFSTDYGNATFYISDDGTSKNQFYVYRTYYLGNKKFAEGDTQIKAGDEVIICGSVVNFKGNTPETAQGKSFVYSLNGVTAGGEQPGGGEEGEATGDGTAANPFNSVAANQYAAALANGEESAEDIYIKGKVVSIREQFGTEFGNATFYISDDGTSAGQFYVYRALYLGNQKYTSGTLLNVGDEVVVCGRVTNYMGNTPETVQGKAYVVSINGNTQPGEGGGDQPGGGAEGGGEVSGNTITVNAADLGLENGTAVPTLTLSDGTTLTFDGGGNNNAPKYYTTGNTIRMYPKNSMTVKSSKKILSIDMTVDVFSGVTYNASGDISIEPGTFSLADDVIKFTGINALQTTITNTSGQTGAASQIRFKKIVITYAE